MVGPLNPKSQPSGATRRTAVGLILGAPLLGACASVQQSFSQFSNPFASPQPDPGPAGPQQQPLSVGTGQVKVGLILPLSAAGNAGVAAQSMKNAAEMALAEFQNPNVQLLIKDDGGSAQGAQQGTQQALAEGSEIILGPLFAVSVPAAAQLTRAWTFSELLQFQADVARVALRAKGPGGATALDLSRDLLAIARSGLKGWQEVSGLDESRNLDPLSEIVDSGRTYAERALEAHRASGGDPASVVKLWQIA